MKKLYVYLFVFTVLAAGACSNKEPLKAKKEQLKEYKREMKELQKKIAALEEDIAVQDPGFSAADKNAALITTIPLEKEKFEHFIEVRGSVSSDRNVTISAEVPAEVRQVKVEKGEKVKKGQLLVLQNAEIPKRNIEELQTSLELAATRFERQANLWERKIGTEMQYLEAKNNKESLERRLASARAQLDNYIIRAPFSGTVDDVPVKEGEMAQPGMPLIRLVSLEGMYIVADISEAYLGQFEAGDSVKVRFPSLNKEIQSTISSVGQVINQNNRTFEIQVNLPDDEKLLRPNLLAVVKIKDFAQANAMVVPANLIQHDNRGDYVYVVAEIDDGLVAEKKHVERGMTYNNETMVKSGLEEGDQLIDEGAREVAEGIRVRVAGENSGNRTVSSK